MYICMFYSLNFYRSKNGREKGRERGRFIVYQFDKET